MKSSRVRISLVGRGIGDRRYPFRSWIKVLDNFFRLVRTSHFALTKERVKKGETRPTFSIAAGFQRKGSVVQDFEIAMPDQESLFTDFERNPLWEGVADSFNFIVSSSRLAEEGKDVDIQEDLGSPFYYLKTGDSDNSKFPRVYRSIFEAEFQLNSAFYEIASQAGPDTGLERIIFKSAARTLVFEENLRRLLRPEEKLGDETLLRGNVLVFSKEFQRGRFEVFSDQNPGTDVPPGKYSFKITQKQSALEYIEASKKAEVLLKVRPIYSVYKTGHKRLSKLLVMGIRETGPESQLILPKA